MVIDNKNVAEYMFVINKMASLRQGRISDNRVVSFSFGMPAVFIPFFCERCARPEEGRREDIGFLYRSTQQAKTEWAYMLTLSLNLPTITMVKMLMVNFTF